MLIMLPLPRLHGRAKFLAGQQQPADEVQIKHLRPSGQGDVFKRHLRRDGGIGIIAAGSIEQHDGAPSVSVTASWQVLRLRISWRRS